MGCHTAVNLMREIDEVLPVFDSMQAILTEGLEPYACNKAGISPHLFHPME